MFDMMEGEMRDAAYRATAVTSTEIPAALQSAEGQKRLSFLFWYSSIACKADVASYDNRYILADMTFIEAVAYSAVWKIEVPYHADEVMTVC